MKRTCFFFLCLFSSSLNFAQFRLTPAVPEPVLTLSLAQAVDLGLKNRADLHSQQLAILLAKNTLKKARHQWLPKLDATNSLRYNTQLQTTILPGGLTIPGSSTGSPAGSDAGQRIRFGTRHSNVASLNLDQPLYNPSLRTDVQIGRKNLELEREILHQTETEARLTIAEAYYTALLRRQEAQINQQAVARYQETYNIAQATIKIGTTLENDRDKSAVDYRNAVVQARKSEQNYQLSLQNVGRVLNLAGSATLVLTDSLTTSVRSPWPNQPFMEPDGTVAQYADNRSEIRQQQLQSEVTVLKARKIEQEALPTVSVFGNYSAQYQADNPNLFNGKSWSPYNYLGLSFSLTILNRNDLRDSRAEYILRRQQDAVNLANQQRTISYELQEAATNLRNARDNLGYVEASYQQAEGVVHTYQAQYRLGALLYNRVTEAEQTLATAAINYVTGLYDYVIAQLRWQKTTGGP